MRGLALMALVTMIGCSSASEKKASAPAPPPVKDDTALLLPLNRTSAKVVPDHLLGKSALPGGTRAAGAARPISAATRNNSTGAVNGTLLST